MSLLTYSSYVRDAGVIGNATAVVSWVDSGLSQAPNYNISSFLNKIMLNILRLCFLWTHHSVYCDSWDHTIMAGMIQTELESTILVISNEEI